MKTTTSKVAKTIIARCDRGEDLYNCLDNLVKENEVRSGCFQVIGALSRAKVGIYEGGKYEWVEHEGSLEISSCVGNVTLKEGMPFVHCHLMLTDYRGTSIGGHLGPGCIVGPTAEIHLRIYAQPIARRHDPETNLWILDI